MLCSICCMRAGELAVGEVLVAVVDRLELAAVDGHCGVGKQLHLPAQQDELAADPADRLAVVAAEVGDGLEVGHQPTREPDQLDVALRLAFEPPAGLDAVQVPVDVDLQQRGRVIRRPPGLGGLCALKTELS